MALHKLLESLSVDTWERLRDSRALQIRFGEETITDLLLLDLKRKNPIRTRLIQTPKIKEKQQGTDWEWWIGSSKRCWLRFAVQAKKLSLKSFRYSGLAHKVAGVPQIDLLEKFAARNRAVPLYCFYNFVPTRLASNAWRCCQSFDEPQLACTITPLENVKTALKLRGWRTFKAIHQFRETVPWRCLARCAKFQATVPLDGKKGVPSSQLPPEVFGRQVFVHSQLPPEISAARETGRLEHFPAEIYDKEIGLFPKRIVVMEFDPDDEEAATKE